ncbi:replication-relaxation family protein [Nocardia rhizosphaerihabitans]|uniref:replication-relaxation family protein n=1 Tax=Nocardia rhizosphaerihabitans TaxID=1691570 RepID=UPI003671F77B
MLIGAYSHERPPGETKQPAAGQWVIYYGNMMISPRDVQILHQVHRFGQLTSHHIRVLEFPVQRSATSLYNVLRRLTAAGMLTQVEKRGIGGWKGGSGQWVYQLGTKGYNFLEVEAAARRRRVTMDEHAIGIADVYVATVEAERRGELVIHSAQIEREGLIRLGEVELIPDLTLYLHVAARGQDGRLFVEVDTGWENRAKIEEKLRRYYHLYRNWPHETFPRIVFLSTSEYKMPMLRKKIDRAPEEVRPLFYVDYLGNFPALLTAI